MTFETPCGYEFGNVYCDDCDNQDYCHALIKEKEIQINLQEETNGTKNFKTRSTGL